MKTKLNAKVIFDNGGGTTLHLDGVFAHYYDDASQAARDYSEYITSGTTDGWDGHEVDLLDNDDDDDVRNGGLLVCDIEDIDKLVADAKNVLAETGDEDEIDYICEFGRNVSDFVKVLIK